MARLKAVLVGCGGMSTVWLNALRHCTEAVEIVGLVDIHAPAAETRRQEFALHAARTGTDLDAMLQQCQPDVVFDLTVPEAHYAVVMTALRHGCHVLGEKPLADSMEHARAMVAAAQAAGRTYAVIQNRRYHAPIRRVRRLVASGAIGQLTTIHCDFFLAPHFGGFRDRMRHVLLLDMAIHTFDAARFMSGADPRSVYCHEWNPAGSWYEHDASAVAIFEMTQGIVYTYRGSWCAEGLNTAWESTWRLIGTAGSVTWDGANQIAGQRGAYEDGFDATMHDLAVPDLDEPLMDGGHLGQIRDFLSCLSEGRTPETVAADNIQSLAMVFGAIKSAGLGRRVELSIEAR